MSTFTDEMQEKSRRTARAIWREGAFVMSQSASAVALSMMERAFLEGVKSCVEHERVTISPEKLRA